MIDTSSAYIESIDKQKGILLSDQGLGLLSAIFEAEDLLEFRWLGDRVGTRFATAENVLPAITWLEGLGKGTHIYFGANPRSREGSTAADVLLARCLFADFDDDCTVEQARMAWTDALLPEPTAIIRTGGGVHAWWRLSEPMHDLALWTRHQKSLADRLKSDRAVTDAPRIMRLPGFRNWKYESSPLAELHAIQHENVYDLSEFPPPIPEATPRPTAATVAGTQRSLSALSMKFCTEGYCMPSGRRSTIFTVACDMHARGWQIADATRVVMRRAELLNLTPDDLRDVPRQIENAFKTDRTPIDDDRLDVHPVPDEDSRVLVPVPLGELLQKHRNAQLRRVIIDKVLRSGETMNVIAAPKMGKSWLVTNLAAACATGTPWLGINVQQGRALIIDNELHEETLAYRLRAVFRARGQEPRFDEAVDVTSLRGELVTFDNLATRTLNQHEPGKYQIVILDAFYRFISPGVSENDNGAMARYYNMIDGWAKRLDCCFVCVHHTSKGNQSEKEVTDVGSGAGSMSRACDSHVILRHHEEEAHLVMEAGLRSFEPFQPKVLRWEWPRFEVAEEMDASRLRKAKRGSDDGWTPERFVQELVVGTPAYKEIESRGMDAGLSRARCLALRKDAEAMRLLVKSGSTCKALWARRK